MAAILRHQHCHFFIEWIFTMHRDKQFRVVENWALASDGAQWVLQRKTGTNKWMAISFVRSTKGTLARCMGESGVPAHVAAQLLADLPDDFEAWHERFCHEGCRHSGRSEKAVMEATESPFYEAA